MEAEKATERQPSDEEMDVGQALEAAEVSAVNQDAQGVGEPQDGGAVDESGPPEDGADDISGKKSRGGFWLSQLC